MSEFPFLSDPELVSGSQDTLDSKSKAEMLKQVQHDMAVHSKKESLIRASLRELFVRSNLIYQE